MVSTNDASYGAVARPRVTIKTLEGDTLYTFNAFNESNDINLVGGSMENAVGENGSFSLTIDDSNNLIPKDNIHNVKVFLEIGKTEASLEHFLIGYGDIFRTDRPETNYQQYVITGTGSRIWAYQLMISRREIYHKKESDAKVYNIIDNALTKRLWRPLKQHDLSIEDITGFSPDGIDTAVNTPYTVVDESFTYFGDLCDKLCDVTGAVWFIDYSTGSEIFTLTYNSSLQTPIIIKSGDLADKAHDPANTTSYILNSFGVEDNSSTDAGTATRLLTTTAQDEVQIFEQDDNNGATNTVMRAIGQQVVIDNDVRRIESIELLLSKNGDPESPNSRLNGDVVLDNGSNKPSNSNGNILDEFHIDLGSIEQNAKFIKVNVDISAKKLDVAQSKKWVRIFQRSGNQDYIDAHTGTHLGDPVDDNSNCIQWRHNNVLNTDQGLYSGTSTTGGGDTDSKGSMTWNTTKNGPLYGLRINSDIRRLFARTNPAAAKRIRLREVFLPTDFLSDPEDVMRFLSINLSQTSKGRRGIGDFVVTIPNNFVFRPYQHVEFQDGLSGISDTLKIQRAGYSFAASGDDDGSPVGTLGCNLTLSGLYNTLVSGCSCI